MTPLRVRAAVAVSKPLSQNREIAVCSSLSSSGHPHSVSVGAAKNPTASWVVCPTAVLPILAPNACTSLPFVLLTPPAAPSSCVRSELPVSVWFVHAPELQFSVWSCACSQAPGFSLVSGQLPVQESSPLPSAGGYCFPVHPSVVAASPSVYLPIPVHRFMVPHFEAQYSGLKMFVCRDPDVSSYVSG